MSELLNSENYNEEIEESVKDITALYMRIVKDYLNFMGKTDSIKKNTNTFKFIVLRGLETMTHVFNYILFSTKNLDVTQTFSEKSMSYYVEFISQISKLSSPISQQTFPPITSRDAVVYVYKKTIFEIQKQFIFESSEETTKKCKEVQTYTQRAVYEYIEGNLS